MTEVTVYTKEQQDEVEAILTLLAGSNRWSYYVGLPEDTEEIDSLIEQGKIVQAVGHLQMVSLNSLTFELASVAIRARQANLAALQAIEDEEEIIRERTTLGDMVEGCSTDEEIQLTQAIGDLLEEQVFATAEELPLEGCLTDEEIQLAQDEAEAVRLEREEWGVTDIHRRPTDEVPHQWTEGRGYGNFPKEGL